jgi:MFS family permease
MIKNFSQIKKPLLLWSVVTLFFAFQFILRLSVGILREDIIAKYNIDTIMFGSLAGFYYLGYSSMQIPFGIMLDRFNFRSVIIFAILITVIGTLPFVLTNNWYLVLAGRFLIGAGSAVGFLAVTKVIKLFFKEAQHSQMIAFSFTFGLLGAVFGGKPMKIIFNDYGYEQGFILLMLVSTAIAFIIFLVKDKSITRIEEQSDNTLPNLKDIVNLLLNPVILLIGVSGGLMVGALEGFADVWSMPFFNHVYGINIDDSILITSFIYIGMCFGGPILAFLADYLGSENRVILLTNIFTIGVFILLFLVHSWNFYALSALMIFLGILCCYQVVVFTQVSRLVDKNVTGLAIAVTNCLNMSFGYLFHFAISSLMQASSTIMRKDDPYLYIVSLSIIPIACFIGQLGFFYLSIKPKKLAIA